jgi:hypothetical protein
MARLCPLRHDARDAPLWPLQESAADHLRSPSGTTMDP